MRDPHRNKNRTRLQVDAKYKDGKETRLYSLVNKDVIERISDETRMRLEEELKKVSPSPVSGINTTIMSFQYSDKEALKDFDFADTLVDVHLPYCLHVPNGYEMGMEIPEHNIKALIIFHSPPLGSDTLAFRRLFSRSTQDDMLRICRINDTARHPTSSITSAV